MVESSQRTVESVKKTQSKGPDSAPRGASGNALAPADRWRGEIANHRLTLFQSLRDMAAEPLQTIMTVLVIAIALALPGALYLAVENLERLSGNVEASTQITVFVEMDASETVVATLDSRLRTLSGVGLITFISPDQALEEFQALSGFGRALDYLSDSPLPAVFVVQPDSVDLTRAGLIAEQIEKFAGVDQVQVDMQWLQRLRSMLEIGEKLITALGITLALGVLLAVANTIRLAIQSRTDEIIVIRLVGGTDAYVRRPFLYTGVVFGFFGGLVAVIFLSLLVFWLNRSIEVLASLYESRFVLHGLDLASFSSVLGGGAILGLLGAWLAVQKHLKGIEP
jgi:cell division transport system permease protein